MQFDLEVLKNLLLNKLIFSDPHIGLVTESDQCLYAEIRSFYKLLSGWFSKKFQANCHPDTLDKEYANFKMQTSLSASQLAYLIKLLIETDVIRTKSLFELFKFLSDHVQTKGSVNVSADSLYLRYFENDDSSKKVVENLLIEMLNEIDNNDW